MNHSLYVTSLVVLSMASGCDQSTVPSSQTESSNVDAAETTPSQETAGTVESARQHIQSEIDKVLGGATDLTTKLLGFQGVDFKSIDSIEITKCVPSYTKEGKKVDNSFIVTMRVVGYDPLKGPKTEKSIERMMLYLAGEWMVTL